MWYGIVRIDSYSQFIVKICYFIEYCQPKMAILIFFCIILADIYLCADETDVTLNKTEIYYTYIDDVILVGFTNSLKGYNFKH